MDVIISRDCILIIPILYCIHPDLGLGLNVGLNVGLGVGFGGGGGGDGTARVFTEILSEQVLALVLTKQV